MFSPKACLLDLDGVLLDTEPLHSQAWTETASFYGKKLNQIELLSLKGRRRKDCAEKIVSWIERKVNVEDLLSVHKPISERLLKDSKPMAGAERLVKWCHEKELPMALVTSSSSKSVAYKSKPHSWLKLIKVRVQGDDLSIKKGKPAPDPFLIAAERLNVDPRSCWALEDSDSGTKAAKSAGCKVWVLDHQYKDVSKINNWISDSNPLKINHLNQFLSELKKSYQ